MANKDKLNTLQSILDDLDQTDEGKYLEKCNLLKELYDIQRNMEDNNDMHHEYDDYERFF